jgi:hypothetical protein
MGFIWCGWNIDSRRRISLAQATNNHQIMTRARKILTIDAAELDYSSRIDAQSGQIFVNARRRLSGFCFACHRSVFAGERAK